MYSLAAPKARLFRSNRNVKALEYLIYLCSIHLCMCTILIWECCLCRIFIHPLMKHSDSCSFLFPTFSVISPLQSLPVTISLLFPFSHTVSTFSPSSTIHTHTSSLWLCLFIQSSLQTFVCFLSLYPPTLFPSLHFALGFLSALSHLFNLVFCTL